jgi:hypothetical protein
MTHALALLAALLLAPLVALPAVDGPGTNELAGAYAKHLRETKGILEIRTLHASGTGPGYLDVVFVSAGFTPEQIGEFHQVSERLTTTLLSGPAWSRYRSLINIHAVFVGDKSVASSQLGVVGYDGHILFCDQAKAVEYARYAANAATAVVIHNSGFSTANSGVWGVPTLNRGDSSMMNPMTVVHELGHGFAGLGDEYIQRNDAFNEDAKVWEETTVDVTPYENPRLCKWHYWVEAEWPGLFGPLTLPAGTKVVNAEGAGWVRGLYRPEEGCIMRCNRGVFCAVCNEAMEGNFLRYLDLLPVVEPGTGDIVLWQGESLNVHVAAIELLRQPPGWLKSRLSLYLDGEKIASSDRGEIAFQFSGATATPGIHQLGANLNIQSDAVRRDFGFLSRSRSWRATVLPYKKPEIAVTPLVSVSSDGTVDVPVKVNHAQPALFKLTMAHAPAGAVLEDGHFKWKPAGQTGSWRVDFAAVDEQQHGVTESMEIQVKRTDKGDSTLEVQPLAPVAAVTGKPVALQLQASAKDAGHILYEPVQVLAGVQLNRDTGALSWIPQVSQAGPQRLRFRLKNGTASCDFEVVFWVRRDATPSPVSYYNSYKPQMQALLDRVRQSPMVYDRIFETLRLMRDRYAPVHQKALAEAKTMYPVLGARFRNNCLEELSLHAWEFANKPEVLQWLREIAATEKTETAAGLIKKLDQIDQYNVRRMQEATADDRRKAEARAGLITSWQMSGVYTDGNKGSRELVASVFPPEKGLPADAAWVVAKPFSDGVLDIRRELERAKVKGPREKCAVYLRTVLDVPAAMEARLELGSDDGVKAWINDKEVFANPAERPLVKGQDTVNVLLAKGKNILMLKITQGSSGWEACARVRARDGSALPNLKIELPQ